MVSLNYYYLFIKMYKDFVYLLFLSYLYNFLFIKIYTLLFIYKGVRHLYKCVNIKKSEKCIFSQVGFPMSPPPPDPILMKIDLQHFCICVTVEQK